MGGIQMTLRSVGPETMSEDEHRIGKEYQTWMMPLLLAGPVVGTQFFDQKWVIAISIGIALAFLHEIGGRLHDLCIRLRRTNILLKDRSSN